jgi:hypothetical protein
VQTLAITVHSILLGLKCYMSNHQISTHCSDSDTLYFSLFFKQEMELSLVGLQNAGKTSLVNVVAVCINSHNLRYNLMFAVTFPF